MAGFLIEQALRLTIRDWASTDCEDRPCGIAIWEYAHTILERPAPPLPRHQSRDDLIALLRPYGGLPGYVDHMLTGIGWQRKEMAERGDIGIIPIPDSTCAICLGDRWMAKGAHSVVAVRAEAIIAWGFHGEGNR